MPQPLKDATCHMLLAGKTEQEVADNLNGLIEKHPRCGQKPDVTQQNVSAFKQSGYMRWLNAERTRKLTEKIIKMSNAGHDVTQTDPADTLVATLVAELTVELAWLKENYESGPEKRQSLLQMAAAVVQLRKSNQGKAWLKIEATQNQIRVAKAEKEFGLRPADKDLPTHRGLSPDMLKDIEMALEMMDDDIDHQYTYFSREDVEKLRRDIPQEMIANIADTQPGAPKTIRRPSN